MLARKLIMASYRYYRYAVVLLPRSQRRCVRWDPIGGLGKQRALNLSPRLPTCPLVSGDPIVVGPTLYFQAGFQAERLGRAKPRFGDDGELTFVSLPN